MTDNIIKKIQKLLALADEQGGGTGAERNAALEKAQAMMLKHGLEMSQVGQADAGREVTEEEWDGVVYTSDDIAYSLLPAVLWGCHCSAYITGVGYRQKGRYKFTAVGRPDNIAYARAVYAFVLPQVEADLAAALRRRDRRAQHARYYSMFAAFASLKEEGMSGEEAHRQSREASDEELAKYGKARAEALGTRDVLCAEISEVLEVSKSYATDVSPFVRRGEIAPEIVGSMRSWRRSYIRSCCSVITRRLKDSQRRFVEEHGDTAAALVVQEDHAVNEYLNSLDLKRGSSSSAKLDYSGWASGAEAGSSVTIAGGGSLSSQQRQIGE